jgi:hypothetical protein
MASILCGLSGTTQQAAEELTLQAAAALSSKQSQNPNLSAACEVVPLPKNAASEIEDASSSVW